MTILGITLYIFAIIIGLWIGFKTTPKDDTSYQEEEKLGKWFINKAIKISYLDRDLVPIDDTILDVYVDHVTGRIEFLLSSEHPLFIKLSYCFVIKKLKTVNLRFAEETVKIEVKNKLKR